MSQGSKLPINIFHSKISLFIKFKFLIIKKRIIKNTKPDFKFRYQFELPRLLREVNNEVIKRDRDNGLWQSVLTII